MNNLNNTALYITLTGGGSKLVSNILTAGGASSFFEGCEIPYSTDQIDKIVGFTPHRYTSNKTLRALAENSLKKISGSKKEQVGVGVTAVLNRSDGQRDGRENFIKIMILNEDGLGVDVKTNLNPTLSRMKQEDKCAEIIFNWLKKLNIEKKALTFQEDPLLSTHEENPKT